MIDTAVRLSVTTWVISPGSRSAPLTAALAQRGVKRIEGDLVADATYFSGIPIGGGWEANDLQTWFGAAPSALDVQGNLIRVQVAPSNVPVLVAP